MSPLVRRGLLASIAISTGTGHSIQFNGSRPLVGWNVHECLDACVVIFGLLRILCKVGQAGIDDEQDDDKRSC